ncbi:MAG TPA: hypothetical protein VMM93_03960, partial [Vicinamibacterales bacterium]|nr:hypothetical protein [Vicinamibacterales bacterium]
MRPTLCPRQESHGRVAGCPGRGGRPFAALLVAVTLTAGSLGFAQSAASSGYASLVQLFEEWRQFERPAMADGAPDYTAPTLTRKLSENQAFLKRLDAIPVAGWTRDQQID